MNKRTFGAVAGQNVHAFITAFKSGLPVVQTESVLWFFRAMAPETAVFQNGPDVAGEINLYRGGRWQFGNIHFGGRNASAAGERRQQAQTDVPELCRVVRFPIQ